MLSTNPFPLVPKPIPCDPYEEETPRNAWDLFTQDVLAGVFAMNRNWLQFLPRSSKTVLNVLFPRFDSAGMTEVEILSCISREIFDAGYRPSNRGINPIWTFPV